MAGTGCRPQIDLDTVDNCTLVILDTAENGTAFNQTMTCDSLYKEDIPGSNLYVSCWGSLLAAVSITLQWKAAQALQFAQAAQRRQVTTVSTMSREDGVDHEDDEEDEDDYEDAI